MDFYDKQGIKSWSKGIVPSFVTSNAFIGKSYARVITGYVSDLCKSTSTSQRQSRTNNGIAIIDPIYIVELGAGSGKLAFYILKELEEIKKRVDVDSSYFAMLDQIVYVLTDFTVSNIKFWEGHEALLPFVQQGRLDFARFEAELDDSIFLRVSGKVLAKGQVKNPVVVVGNYLVDTLSQDIFQVEDGVLKEGLVSVRMQEVASEASDKEIDIDDTSGHSTHGTMCSIQNEYRYQTIEDQIEVYYKNRVQPCDELHLARMLKWYQDYFSPGANPSTNSDRKTPDGASLLIPIGFIKALRTLTDLSCGRALVITGDKGASNPNRFRGLTDPHIAFHGSFSVMANFHAIELYCMARSGFAFMSDQDEVSLMVNAFVLTGDEKESTSSLPPATCKSTSLDNNGIVSSNEKAGFQNLRNAFEDHINSFSPNDFYLMQRSLKEEAPNPSLFSIVSLLKLSNWDCELFFKFRDNIISQIPRATIGTKSDFIRGSKKIWNNYYHLDSVKDIAFELGRVMFGLHCWEEALEYYQLSVDVCGDHHIAQHNMGLCYSSLKKYKEAIACFTKSLELKPDYEKASVWIEKIKVEQMASLD